METSLTLLGRLAGKPTDADWQRLCGLYEPLLRTWLIRSGVPDAEADDLVQEVLLVVSREVAAFDRRREGAFRSWLRTILVNRIRNWFRDCQYRPQAGGGSAFAERLAELESPEGALSRRWDLEHDEHVVARAMQLIEHDFAPTTWQAFCRHVIENEPAAQVAQELGLSLNSVLLAKSRILKRLRQELNGLVDC